MSLLMSRKIWQTGNILFASITLSDKENVIAVYSFFYLRINAAFTHNSDVFVLSPSTIGNTALCTQKNQVACGWRPGLYI